MKQKGFTLIELMIVVAIIGIIAAIAYPSYVEQVRKTRRANAQADLIELASFMERYYTNNASYRDDSDDSPTLPFDDSPQDSGTKYYDLSVHSASDAEYILTAKPKKGQDADRCGEMSIDQKGSKSAGADDCWQ